MKNEKNKERIIQGLLMPCHKKLDEATFNYKVRTEEKDYYLKLKLGLELKADSMVWENVEAVGFLDSHREVFNVKKLRYIDPGILGFSTYFDNGYPLFEYERQISRWGKIETDSDLVAC